MKICLVSPLDYTGISYYSHSLARALSSKGVDVCLVTTDAPLAQSGHFIKTYKAFVGTYGNRGKIKKGLAYVFSMPKVIIYVLRNNFNVVHFQILDCPQVDVFIFISLKLLGQKIVWTPHDIVSLKGEKANKYFRIMYKLSNIIIVHNQSNKLMISEKFSIAESKISVIPHGNYNYFMHPIEKAEAREKLKLPLEKKIFLIIGNLHSGKGIETSIEALRYIKQRNHYFLLVAGKVSKGFDMDMLLQKIKKWELEEKVILRTEFIPDDKIEYYYKASDVCLVPYQKVYESGVLRYAFSCGLPVIASDLKEFLEILRDEENSLICKAGDSENLAKKIDLLLDDENLRKRLSLNSKRLSDRDWDWDRISDATISVYSSLQGN